MSTFNDIDVKCEKCGEEFRGTLWTAVHAKQDPELRDLLLGGELNMVMCPQCAHVAYQDHFVLYQDPDAELIAYVYPPSQKDQAAVLTEGMFKGFEEAQSVYEPKERLAYKPILVFGLETLVEMMREEEERGEQSQIAQILCKEMGMPVLLLTPAAARQRQLPRTIPLGSNTERPNRSDVLKGLEDLLKLNPALTVYSNLREKIIATPAWSL